MAHPQHATPIVALLLSLIAGYATLTGCTDQSPQEPTAAQAGETLKTHITQMLKTLSASDIKVTDPGDKDIPCGDGMAKRTYGATAVDRVGAGTPSELVVDMWGALEYTAKYRSVSKESNPARLVVTNTQYQTKITLTSPEEHQMIVAGETNCLPAK